MNGISIHIGVNELDFVPDYNGRNLGRLFSCINDAESMSRMMGAGFAPPVILKNAEKNQVVSEIRKAKEKLQQEGILIITYAGHGISIFDETGDENDSEFDSTWCLKDGFLLDDTITDLLTDFADGVRIVVISDSCHSGTIVDFQELGFTPGLIRGAQAFNVDFHNIQSYFLQAKGFDFAKFDEAKLIDDAEFLRHPKIEKAREKELISQSRPSDFISFPNILADLDIISLLENVKTLPRSLVSRLAEQNNEIKEERELARTNLRKKIKKASLSSVEELFDSKQIILLSACQDNEETIGGCTDKDNSYFTAAILEIMQSFPAGKGYRHLHELLKEKLKKYNYKTGDTCGETREHQQNPHLKYSKGISPDFLTNKKPFTI